MAIALAMLSLKEFDVEESGLRHSIPVVLNDKTMPRPCIQKIIEEIKTENKHRNHLLNLAVATELKVNGYTDEEVHALFSHDPDYSEHVTQSQINSLRWYPHRCETLQGYGICIRDKCRFFVNFKAK